MPNARERAAAKKENRRQFHADREAEAKSLIEKVEIQFGRFRAQMLNTSDTQKTRVIAEEVKQFLIKKSDEIPRSV